MLRRQGPETGEDSMQLDVQKLDQPVGAIIGGWDPAESLGEQQRAEIRDLLRAHLVLVFRGNRQPEDRELIDFAQNFGDLVIGSEWFQDSGDHPEILPINNLVDDEGVPQGTAGSEALGWHADYSYVPTVGKESFLNAIELPEASPRTYFCSQYRALDTLPKEMIKKLRTLRAYHSITDFVSDAEDGTRGYGRRTMKQTQSDFLKKREHNRELGIERPRIPTAEHPVIMRHPESGREILYISPFISKYIVGMPRDESDELLTELCEHSTKPENVYAHTWQTGDMVMFDTLGCLHRRDSWDPAQRRVMHQLSTKFAN
jgi:alpha-ketoglutarate-dependent taurine dioxygenase